MPPERDRLPASALDGIADRSRGLQSLALSACTTSMRKFNLLGLGGKSSAVVSDHVNSPDSSDEVLQAHALESSLRP